jgi:hypothetical protein
MTISLVKRYFALKLSHITFREILLGLLSANEVAIVARSFSGRFCAVSVAFSQVFEKWRFIGRHSRSILVQGVKVASVFYTFTGSGCNVSGGIVFLNLNVDFHHLPYDHYLLMSPAARLRLIHDISSAI